MSKIAVISDSIPQICDALKSYGYKLIYSDSVDGFIPYEQNHADMQIINVDSKIFVLSVCKNIRSQLRRLSIDFDITTDEFDGTYPNNILLNAKLIGKNLVGNIKYLDSGLVKHCTENGFNLINVNQGYTACSCVNIADKAVITTDPSIYKALKSVNVDVLKVAQNGIKLHGAGEDTSGFIGGASVTLADSSVLFFGDITKHQDYDSIREFCNKHNVMFRYIKNLGLTDIGGAILLNISQ